MKLTSKAVISEPRSPDTDGAIDDSVLDYIITPTGKRRRVEVPLGAVCCPALAFPKSLYPELPSSEERPVTVTEGSVLQTIKVFRSNRHTQSGLPKLLTS